ncbi:unnamed protein product [Closterium sp. Yama58-4]|nr:unnamed protein product [Closterium sp. Yama58-4]
MVWWQLAAARHNGHIAAETIVLAVPDREGRRIGSGGATLGAIQALRDHLGESSSARLPTMKVLLVHAGGDSKRLPWANPCGKPFVPFPLLAGDDPDGPPLTLFDHILAVSALALQALPPTDGALFIMTGDVLPCFNASHIRLPSHGALVVTAAVPLDVASRHGVILALDQTKSVASDQIRCVALDQTRCVDSDQTRCVASDQTSHVASDQQKLEQQQHERQCDTGNSPELVVDLLQKPSVAEMVERGALCRTGGALLDTGIYAVCGDTWRDLIGLATSDEDLLAELLASGEELSLYEELAAAWVPARHAWLSTRPLGSHLLAHLSSHSLFHHCADDLSFLHFGTASEYLHHMRLAYTERMPRRHLSAVAAPTDCHVAQSAALISSHVPPGACVGEGSVVSDSWLVRGTRIGDRCVVIGVDTAAAAPTAESAAAMPASAMSASAMSARASDATSAEPATSGPPVIQSFCPLVLPSHMCLWQVPLKGGREVTLCCGVDDNPKLSLSGGGSFCGRPWGLWLGDRGLKETDIWPGELSSHLFSPHSPGSICMLCQALSQQFADTWRRSDRTSLALLHRQIDFPSLLSSALHRRSVLLAAFARAAINGGGGASPVSASGGVDRTTAATAGGSLGRNLASLTHQLLLADVVDAHSSTCHVAAAVPLGATVTVMHVEVFSTMALCLSTMALCLSTMALCLSTMALCLSTMALCLSTMALCLSTMALCLSTMALCLSLPLLPFQPMLPAALPLGATVTVTLPVRLDIAGGWSDTPPWSLERCGTVLNMAVMLDGKRPVGATVTVVKEPGVLMEDDSGASLHIPDPATIPTHLSPQEPFVVVKAALLVTRISTLLSPSSSSSSLFVGLHIRTWADVPRGSGLGTSSIVAAALVRALLLLVRGGGRSRNGAEQTPEATDGAPEATEKPPEKAPEVTDEEVSRLVLLQEQRMGTGGGWQDQVGGLYPGVKCTTSLPTRPIRLVVDPLPLLPAFRSNLQQRLVVVFVGQVRLARNVLKNVVTRYLQRDSRLISTIQRLTDLAEIGRRAIATADLDLLGRVLSHTWDLHQELDPHCSNPHVDALLAAVEHLSCGAKLAGAGGGGFAMIMGRSEEGAEEIKGILRGMGEPVRVYDWAVGF